MIQKIRSKTPKIHSTAYISPAASIIGEVIVGRNSSVWPGAVIRADVDKIVLGENTNIQDCSVLHPNFNQPVVLGNNVTVGHSVILHGCQIGNNCLLGMGSIVLDGASIGDNCLIGAGALVTQNQAISARSLVLGSPAKVVRSLKAAEIKQLVQSARNYIRLKKVYERESAIEEHSSKQ